MQVNVENVRKWVEALRSGQYNQGTSTLKSNAGYCCLGVACEVSGLGTWKFAGSQSNNGKLIDIDSYEVGDDSRINFLPEQVQEWLGITTENPELEFNTEDGDIGVEKASVMNDEYGFTFAEIADAIERTYLQ